MPYNTAERTMADTSDLAQENVWFQNQHPRMSDSQEEAWAGLNADNKTMNPRFFYDQAGSELFEHITRTPEYYLTRTERSILTEFADDIAGFCGERCVLIEPGSGSCEKVRLLLPSLQPSVYVPMDISEDFLRDSAHRLSSEFSWLDIRAVCADFANVNLNALELPNARRVVFYPGSTLGNMTPDRAVRFLLMLRRWVIAQGKEQMSGGILIGVDLHKPEAILNAAYNDAEGVNAAFNMNALHHLNRVLKADFNTEQFAHRAFYNQELQRIELYLVSQQDQTVNTARGPVEFLEGESIHTENSYKYTIDGFSELAHQAGLTLRMSWVDEDQLFSVHYLEPL